MKTFIVGYIDWGTNDLILERHTAEDWQNAVVKHSKYPWREEPQDDLLFTNRLDEEAFKQECFNCDCMMGWMEI